MSSTRASGRMSPIEGERRLNSATAASPGPLSASRESHAWENSTSSLQPRRGRAGVDRLAGEGDSFAQVLGVPGRGDAARGVEDDRGAMPAVLPREHRPQRSRVRLRVAAAQLGRVATFDAEVERVELVLAHRSVLDLAHEVGAAGRELVDAARAVDDVGALGAELDERVRQRARQLRRVHAEHERARTGGVRQRAEHVEHGTRRQLAPDGGCVLHRRMVRLREQEAEAELVDRPLDPLRRQLEAEAERLEHVGGAARRRRSAVAVLRDRRAACGRDQGGRGGDVVRVRAVAACADDVDEVASLRVDPQHVLAHRLRAAGDLVRRLALRAQRDEEAGDLRGR